VSSVQGMYLRTIQRKNKDGTTVRYIQLAHNEWDPVKKTSVAKVVHSFGREDRLDRDALQRMIDSVARYLGIAAPTRDDENDGGAGVERLRPVASRPAGGGWLLDGMWRQLGIDKIMKSLLKGRRLDPAAERVLFMLVANRALAPADHKSKLASLTWLDDVHLPGVDDLGEDPNVCYRAMDWLLEIEEQLAEQVYWAVADLLDLEVDLLLFDTTSTYFETDRADPAPDADGEGPTAEQHLPDHSDHGTRTAGFRTYGNSKDHRPDLPQVVVGMAVTRSGIPIRVWSWPGDVGDSPLIRQVKDDLKAWKLGRVVWAADRGFTSAENRRYLQRGGGHYIMGEKLRHGSKDAQQALKRQGRYKTVADNLQVKEVVLDDGTMRDRFVVCRNPDEAERDALVRAQIVERLEAALDGSDDLPDRKRAELAGALKTRPAYNRFLRITPKSGLLRIDRAAITADAKLDGKFLLRTSDPTLSVEDIALGYKQLLQVERGWRDLKLHLDLRPVFHRLEDRIRAHVLLCWLALLLARIAENATGDTWRNLRRELHQLAAIESGGPAGRLIETTQPTPRHGQIFNACGIKPPPRFLDITPS
jgi:hypothetical protein